MLIIQAEGKTGYNIVYNVCKGQEAQGRKGTGRKHVGCQGQWLCRGATVVPPTCSVRNPTLLCPLYP